MGGQNLKSKALLVGNGVNRLSGDAGSWEKVLIELAGFIDCKHIVEESELKPFTLIFEAMVLFALEETAGKEIEIKKKVAELVRGLPRNDYHAKIIQSSAKHILTTNYDYNLENSVRGLAKEVNTANETKYSSFRRQMIAEKSVWHIHGEADVPNSIMLGHEHYSGGLQKLRSYVTGDRKKPPRLASPFKLGKIDFDDDRNLASVYSWLDIFLRDDIHIFGFSLDYTEIDLWWLITYKAKLQYNKKGTHGQVGSTIYYPSIIELGRALTTEEEEARAREKAKISLLLSLGVSVPKLPKVGSYPELYDVILRQI